MEKFSAIGKSKIKNSNVKSEGDMKKDEYYNDKVDVCSPDGIFCVKTKCVIHNWTKSRKTRIYYKKVSEVYCVFHRHHMQLCFTEARVSLLHLPLIQKEWFRSSC